MDTPKNGTMYYFVSDSGQIKQATWQDSPTDEGRRKIGNAFTAKTQAEHHLSELKEFTKVGSRQRTSA